MRVGTSALKAVTDNTASDHPHACGDKKSVAQALLSVTGSSPCVWGQAERYAFDSGYLRIIPMRVGTRGRI